MAEPEKQIEIEDVLSSIRRLVAQDPAPPRSEPTVVEAPAEALVLTASDRVEEPTSHESDFGAPVEELAPADDFALAEDTSAQDEESLDQDWEAVNQAGHAEELAPEPEASGFNASEDLPEAALPSEELDVPFTQELEEPQPEAAQFEPAEEALDAPAESSPFQLEPHMRSEPVGDVAVAEAPAFAQDEFEPDEGDAAPLDGALNAFAQSDISPEHLDQPAEDLAFSEAAPQDEPMPQEAFAQPEEPELTEDPVLPEEPALTDETALPEEPVFTEESALPEEDQLTEEDALAEASLPQEETPPFASPDEDGADPDLAETSWADDSEAEESGDDWQTQDELMPELEAAAEALTETIADTAEVAAVREATRRLHLNRPEAEILEAENDAAPLTQTEQGGAHIFDEAALRQLVSRMVRAELQGDLGDQMTRKIRRLVRQEINRALISREFE